MTFFCVWPLIIFSGLLFGMGLLAIVRGRFRGKYNWASQQLTWVGGTWSRVLGVLLMLPFLVGVANGVVDLIALSSNNDPGWNALSLVLAFVHLGALLFFMLAASIVYLMAPKTYES